MTNSSTICVDANIIVRLVAPHPESTVPELWNQWLSEHRTPVAPTLLRYEATNALHHMNLGGVTNDSLARDLLETALRLPFSFYDDPFISRNALTLAERFGLKATCNAHYLALSEHLKCEFWTTDKRSYNAVHDTCIWVRFVDES